MEDKENNKLKKLHDPVLVTPWWAYMGAWSIPIILAIDFIADSLVFIVTLKILKQPFSEIKKFYKKAILQIVIFGLIADFIGIAFVILSIYIYGNLIDSTDFIDILSFISVIISILITAVCIYFFNLKISFKKLDLSNKHKKIVALSLAIFTAPYTFIIFITSLLFLG